MNKEREQQQRGEDQSTGSPRTTGNQERQPRSSAFNEKPGEEKSTVNPEEEADLEQQRKDALTERD